MQRRLTILAALAALSLTATGCSQSQPIDEEIHLSAHNAPTEGPSEEEEEEKTTSKPPAERAKPKCAELRNDPRDAFPSNSQPGRMPAVDYLDYNFWISDIDNQYDPCDPLSWVVFRGGLGDVEKPAHTAASITDGIAFYVNGVPDGEMRLFTSIERVETDGDGTATFSWGERTGSTAEGITAHYSVSLKASGGSIKAIDGDIAEFNERWNDPQNEYQLGTYDER
ncbi:hypothetical protein [Corynebacterium aquatimens]|uniref:Secreted protein n=1 Tax=Corynebacterium aquatimens TaxID=1190508 RepID=A0A931E2N2_9CORY|nr:hypothetical protein [Corynebacterium aquatimens]MBG6123128.1 hypothetical protein [Corynebacterium aquatimens]